MATRNILQNGERALSKVSRDVTDFNQRLHILLDDMRETVIDANGLGLAAPQVGVLRRVALIVDSSDDEFDENDDEIDDDNWESEDELEEVELTDEEIREQINASIIELVNPEIIRRDGEQAGREGCLSVPGVQGMVTRPKTVVVRAQDRDGNFFELEVSDLTARAACHEIDHLNGVIFTSIADRILSEEEIEEMNVQGE
ncbi:MAG: peptide deformylase [Oscillospiraceae bacterium]|nr:peptide deformylase [Oscillospiraceae bacterium]